MKIPFDEFDIRQCNIDDLKAVLDLQEEAFEYLPSEEYLRKNTPSMLRECLESPNYTLGAWYDDRLVAISVLYVPYDEEEDLSHYLQNVDINDITSANYKLCIVSPVARGNSLQFKLGEMLLQVAKNNGVNLICATASPKNVYSIRNMEKLGFVYNRTLEKYGMIRNLYYSFI